VGRALVAAVVMLILVAGWDDRGLFRDRRGVGAVTVPLDKEQDDAVTKLEVVCATKQLLE
jgi:hypothetical protein